MQSRTDLTLPNQLARFAATLQDTLPEALLGIDRPTNPQGEWWIDISQQDFNTRVAWRPSHGFGCFTSELGYGDQPDEVYRSPELAVKRIEQLVHHWQAVSKIVPLSLADIRQLRETRQTTLAAALRINQAAISRLEHRDDMRLSSLQSYFRAMGGRLEVRVHFDSFDAAFSVLPDEDGVAEEAAS